MEFLHKFVGNLGATMAGNVLIGDRLGLIGDTRCSFPSGTGRSNS